MTRFGRTHRHYGMTQTVTGVWVKHPSGFATKVEARPICLVCGQEAEHSIQLRTGALIFHHRSYRQLSNDRSNWGTAEWQCRYEQPAGHSPAIVVDEVDPRATR